MPRFRVPTDGGVFEVATDTEDPTDSELLALVSAQEEPRSLAARYGPLAVRAVGGVAAGVVGAVPGPVTTPLAAGIGGLAEAGAQGIEVATGQREALSLPSIGVEAGLSAVPLGRLAKVGEPLVAGALRGAAKVGAVEAVGAQARSLAARGEPATVRETLVAGGAGAIFGAGTGALEARLARGTVIGGVADEAARKAEPAVADQLPPVGQRQVILPEEALAAPRAPVSIFSPDGKVTAEVAPALETRPSLAFERTLADEVTGKSAEVADAIGALDPDVRKQRFFRQLSATIKEGLFDPTDTARFLHESGHSVDDFFKQEVVPMFTEFERDVSEAGRKLNLVSREKMAVVAAMRRDPKLRELVDAHAVAAKEAAGDGVFSRLWREVTDLDAASKSLVIGQVATAHRNFISQLGRLVLEVPTDAVKKVLPRSLGGLRGNPLATLVGVAKAFTPGDTDRVLGLLERVGPEGDLLARRIFGRSSAESPFVAGGKTGRPIRGLPAAMAQTFRQGVRERRVMKTIFGPVADAAGAYSQLAENFGRRAAFQSRLMQRAEARGLSWQAVVADPARLSEDDLADATRHALETTFAADPTSRAGRAFVQTVRSLGPLGSTFVTFPRYMVNAGKFILDFNPAGALRLVDKTVRAERGADILSKAVTGSMLLGGAYLFRASRYAGEKWYEGRDPDSGKRTNLLGLAGPAIPYLALGELMYRTVHGGGGRPDFRPDDVLQGSVGLRLSPGTRAVLDAMGGRSEEGFDAWRRAAEVATGEYVGRFTVPLRTVKDFAAAYGEDSEAIYYDPREKYDVAGTRTAIPGPTVQNVPFLGTAVGAPPSVSPLTGRPKVGEATLKRQLTGLTELSRTPVEAEFARLGLDEFGAVARTGFPKADREMATRVGALARTLGPTIIASPVYQRASDEAKAVVWNDAFKDWSKEAREHLAETNPDLAEVVAASRALPKLERRAIEAETGRDVDEILYQAAKAAPETWVHGPSGLVPRAPAEAPVPTTAPPSTLPAGPPSKYDDVFGKVGAEVGVDPTLLKAVAKVESNFDPAARSEKHAVGLLQLLPATFATYADEVRRVTGKQPRITDPTDNTVAGALLYRDLLGQTGGNIEAAARLYHGGPSPRQHGPKTLAYGKKVAAAYANLRE